MRSAFHTLNIALFIVIIVHLCSCGNGRPETGGEAGPGTAGAAPREEAAGAPVRPAQVLQTQRQAIPVYETFAGVAPVFQQQNDTTYVINFWATWCKPCVEELPYFERLHQEFAGAKMRVILVSLDFERDLETKLTAFVDQHQLKSGVMVLLDGNYNDWIDRVDASWGGAIPVTLIYNSRERRFFGEQFAGYEELAGVVREVL